MQIESWSRYQALAARTARYPDSARKLYPALGLLEEAGELAGKLAKQLRDSVDNHDAMVLELGDVCWMLSAIASEHGARLEDLEMPALGRESSFAEILPECVSELGTYATRLCDDVVSGLGNDEDVRLAIEGVALKASDVARALDVPLSEVLSRNIAKLASRAERGVLGGSGDER